MEKILEIFRDIGDGVHSNAFRTTQTAHCAMSHHHVTVELCFKSHQIKYHAFLKTSALSQISDD